MKNLNRGFTLVEVMVAIVILGILAAVALPKFFGQSDKAKDSQDVVNVGAAKRFALMKFAEKESHSSEDVFYFDAKNGVMYDASNASDAAKASADGIEPYGVSSHEDLSGKRNGGIGTPKGGIIKITMNSKGDITGIYWTDEAKFDIQVATAGNSGNTQESETPTNQYEVSFNVLENSLYGSNLFTKDANGLSADMSLAKALVSGKSSTNSSGLASSFNELYNIEDFVINEGAASLKTEDGSKLSEWVKKKVEEEAGSTKIDGAAGDRVKVITAVHTTDSKLSSGQKYNATQTLYYDAVRDNGLVKLDVYGTRNVTVEVVKGKTVYYDADGNVITDASTGWTPYESTTKDPFEDEQWASAGYSSPLLKDHDGSDGFAKALTSNYGSRIDGFNEKYGIEGYVTNLSVKTESGVESEVTKMLKEEVSDWNNPSNVRVMTELHSDSKELTVGGIYAATQSLYYGDAKGVTLYGTKDVYALVTKEPIGADQPYTIKYFHDKECIQAVDAYKETDWQKVE